MEYSNEQWKAITHTQGPFLLLAAPGSGKTAVITRRIAYLIAEHAVAPSSILVITFTRAAARQMKERFYQNVKDGFDGVVFGTFHSIFFQILKQIYHYTPANILREDAKYQYIRELLEKEEMELAAEADFIAEVVAEISRVKGEGLALSNYYSTSCSADVFRRVYQGYVDRCRRERRIDFDDMQADCWKLLHERPDVCQMWQQRFAYILVDEFQDVSRQQYELVRLLAKPQDNLFIVGDDDQSIYHFRGASPQIMHHFQKDYPAAKVEYLSTNYRSCEPIVKTAQALIRHNRGRFDKHMRSHRGDGEPVQIMRFSEQRQEHLGIVDEIRRLHDEGLAYSQIAVLFRTNRQPRMLAERLTEYKIPYVLRDSVPSLYGHWVSRDILAYVKLGLGERSRGLFLPVMNRPKRYFSRDLLDGQQVDFSRIRQKLAGRDWMVARLEQLQTDLSRLSGMAPYAAVNYIRKGIGYDAFLKEYARERGVDSEEWFALLEELQEDAGDYTDCGRWFAHIRECEQERRAQRSAPEPTDAVLLATLHASKGLEFDAVFLLDACEDVTPYKKAVKDSEREEERRLFYVGMTRARNRLYVCTAGRIFNKTMRPSRYIKELQHGNGAWVDGLPPHS